MKQKYILYVLLTLLITLSSFAQEKKITSSKTDGIEGLHIYPNPVNNGRIYVSTDQNSNSRDIEIYDMLGKKVFSSTIFNSNKEININHLSPGVYMIKVKENNNSVTRKLVIK